MVKILLSVVLGRSSIMIDNQSIISLILINRLQNWQSIIIGKGDTSWQNIELNDRHVVSFLAMKLSPQNTSKRS